MLNVAYQNFSQCGVPQVRKNSITHCVAAHQAKEMGRVAQKLLEADRQLVINGAISFM